MKIDTDLLINLFMAIFIAFIFVFVDRIVKIPVHIDLVLINSEEFTEQDHGYVEELIMSTKPIISNIRKVTLPLDEQLDESIINNYTVAVEVTPERLFIYTIPSLFTVNKSNLNLINEYFKPAFIINKSELEKTSSIYHQYKLRALGLKLQERNFKSLFNFAMPLVFDYTFLNSKFAQSRNFYVYCKDVGTRYNASWYDWRKYKVDEKNIYPAKTSGFAKMGHCKDINVSTLDYPTSKSKITKVYNSRLLDFDYNYTSKRVQEVFESFKVDFSSNPFLDFEDREKTRYSLFCSIMRSFYSSKLSLSDPKNCKYNEVDLVANFHESGSVYVIEDGKMFFGGSCTALKSNLLYVVPTKRSMRDDDLILDFGSGKYKISFVDNEDNNLCIVNYKSIKNNSARSF